MASNPESALTKGLAMPRAIWKGAIAFGLVHVPVALFPAAEESGIDFDWLDQRSMDPVGYKRVNKRTGKEIAGEHIVKGIRQDDGSYVVLSEAEIKAAYPKATQTIEIERFVAAGEIPFTHFERPYFLEPVGKADKVYSLLREAMKAAGVVGVARLILHTKEHLAVVIPDGAALVVNTLRWASEVRATDALKLPAAGKAGAGLKPAELKMADQLIDSMRGRWKADEFEDQFTEAVHKLVKAKVKAGKVEMVTPLEDGDSAPSAGKGKVIDLTELLAQSLGRGKKPATAARSSERAARPHRRRRA